MSNQPFKGRSHIISSLHALKIAQNHMQSFINERPTAALTRLFKSFTKQIDRIYLDLKSEPLLPQIVRDGINQELNSDVFAIPAIAEKIPLLPPSQREVIETMVDAMLNGEEIKMVGE